MFKMQRSIQVFKLYSCTLALPIEYSNIHLHPYSKHILLLKTFQSFSIPLHVGSSIQMHIECLIHGYLNKFD